MAGIYIHIPFCRSRCIYCGFYSTVSLGLRQRYVDAVCREMELRQQELAEPVSTIYLGGGTPSQLTASQLSQLFAVLPEGAEEITIEANPDNVSPAWVETLSKLPINRISMGAQTFDDNRLRFLHRRHTASQVEQAVGLLRQAGYDNISIDLMYGFPDEQPKEWRQDIERALALGVEHISAYCLMVEEGTALHRMGIAAADEEQERQMYDLLTDLLTAAGYEHYEISNFARPGFRSRHNSCYWNDTPYIGLGAAAHSYTKNAKDAPTLACRSWNVSDIHRYMEAVEHGKRCCEQEHIDEDTHYNDLVTTCLRTSNGLDLQMLSAQQRQYCMREAQRFIDDGLLCREDDRLVLTRKALFVSDMVMAGLVKV